MKHKLSVWKLEREMWWVRTQPNRAIDGWWSGWCVMGGRQRGEQWRKMEQRRQSICDITYHMTEGSLHWAKFAPHMLHAWVYKHTHHLWTQAAARDCRSVISCCFVYLGVLGVVTLMWGSYTFYVINEGFKEIQIMKQTKKTFLSFHPHPVREFAFKRLVIY